MKLREALIAQAPSLELQRAAQAEIARLDGLVTQLEEEVALLTSDRDALWTYIADIAQFVPADYVFEEHEK